MMRLGLMIWWAAYIAGAVIVQRFIPGVDALLPGLLVTLQERSRWQSFWLFLIFVVIQEGSGSLIFGGVVLWYGGLVLLVRVTQSIMLSENFLFIAVLSLCLGLYHGLLTLLMCAIQNIPPNHALILRESIAQALVIPPMWGLIRALRPRFAAPGVQA